MGALQQLTKCILKQRIMLILVIQICFVFLQVFVFYPCLAVHGDVNGRLVRDLSSKNQQQQQPNFQFHVRDVENTKIKSNVSESDKMNKADRLKTANEVGLKSGYSPNWESLESRPIPQWYDDAKVGIFLHWGVYAVPSYVGTDIKNALSEWFWFYWKPENFEKPPGAQAGKDLDGFISRRSDAIESVKSFMKNHYPPDWHYTDFAPHFKAEFFEPKKWAEIFKKSGAKYVVLTSKHHDGFTLWPSKHSWNWNSVDVGPHRDLVGDLGTAVKEAGLHYGLYHSLYEWFNPLYEEDKQSGFTKQDFVANKLMPELKELVTRYKPDVVWSDGQFEAPCSYWNCTNFIAWLYNESPVKGTVVTNDRWGTDVLCKHGGFLTCADRYNPDESLNRKWENCMTIDRESWGYRRNAVLKDYYDMDGLTELLAQTVSNGGNLLMNVGPTADGRISPIFEERLTQFGEWLQINGEGIYETRAWHTTKENNNDVYYTKKQKNQHTDVYAILLNWPEDDKLLLEAAHPSSNTRVTWLGYSGEVTYDKKDNGMILNLPKISMRQIPCQWAWVFKLENLENA